MANYAIILQEIRKLATDKSYDSDATNAVIRISRDSKRVAAVLPDGTYIWQVSNGKKYLFLPLYNE